MSLLVPGTKGWELWKQGADGAYARQSESETPRAADIANLPAGHLTMLFPVKGWYALPFKASSADESLYGDLSAMHAERLGVRWDPMAGQLIDTFLVGKEEENSTLLAVVLKSPGEGELPPRGPKEFDLSARAFSVEGDAVAAWVEFGRWVFAFYKEGRLLYAQATSSETADPDASVLREIKLAMSQLAIQGLALRPQQVQVWSDQGTTGALAEGLGIPARLSPRPDPRLPQPHSKLLPADVRAARRIARARQQQGLGIAALVLVYLGLAGWLGYGLYQENQKIKRLQADANRAAPASDIAAYNHHVSVWGELEPVVNNSRSPLELMFRVVKAIPLTGKLRLKSAEVGDGEIKLSGDAQEVGPINQFSLSLSQTGNLLTDYDWNTPPAVNSPKGWDFNFTGTLKK
ncbi:MAG: hypothetical protein JWO82_2797 [Akkermansiaceae bacterium]|nr:hypothetical protein [Akkermansiaceae bacterium]